jgi:hypothetical protein
MAEHFQSFASDIVHEEHGGPVVADKIAHRDELAIAAEIGEAERMIIQHTQESTRATPMLDVGPAGFAGGRKIKAVAFGDECRFFGSKPRRGKFAVRRR